MSVELKTFNLFHHHHLYLFTTLFVKHLEAPIQVIWISIINPKCISEFEWYEWMFKKCSAGYWEDFANRRRFFEWLAEELNIESQDDWYNITMSVVAERGGGSIVKQYYSHCISKAIESIFPELTWYPWMHKTGIHSNLYS